MTTSKRLIKVSCGQASAAALPLRGRGGQGGVRSAVRGRRGRAGELWLAVTRSRDGQCSPLIGPQYRDICTSFLAPAVPATSTVSSLATSAVSALTTALTHQVPCLATFCIYISTLYLCIYISTLYLLIHNIYISTPPGPGSRPRPWPRLRPRDRLEHQPGRR